MRADNVQDRLKVVAADTDLTWGDITINGTSAVDSGVVVLASGGTVATDTPVTAGDYINGAGTYSLVYEPTNSQLGEWTVT